MRPAPTNGGSDPTSTSSAVACQRGKHPELCVPHPNHGSSDGLWAYDVYINYDRDSPWQSQQNEMQSLSNPLRNMNVFPITINHPHPPTSRPHRPHLTGHCCPTRQPPIQADDPPSRPAERPRWPESPQEKEGYYGNHRMKSTCIGRVKRVEEPGSQDQKGWKLNPTPASRGLPPRQPRMARTEQQRAFQHRAQHEERHHSPTWKPRRVCSQSLLQTEQSVSTRGVLRWVPRANGLSEPAWGINSIAPVLVWPIRIGPSLPPTEFRNIDPQNHGTAAVKEGNPFWPIFHLFTLAIWLKCFTLPFSNRIDQKSHRINRKLPITLHRPRLPQHAGTCGWHAMRCCRCDPLPSSNLRRPRHVRCVLLRRI